MEKKLHERHRQRIKTRYLAEGLDTFEDHFETRHEQPKIWIK